ncbi:hypothetical protein COCOBI_05-6830 [Coccomyxa sp. Obi]|nr:hypothetical protein COCOBI_05-6830 [Coccomyxa sp. Obi]
MPAPKKSPSAKTTKSAAALPEKPAWVSDELWQLAQNTSSLIDRLKKVDNSEAESGCSHAQVAQLLWDQALASPDKQEEFVKLGIIEVAAKHLTGSITTAAPMTGLLSTLAASSVAARDAILACRPSLLPLFTATLPTTSPSSAATIVGALKSLATQEDSRGRLLKGLSNWDLTGLPELIATTDRGMTQVSTDALLLLDALLCAPAPPAAQPPLAQQGGKAKSGRPASAKPKPQAGKGAGKGKADGTAADAAASAQLQESALKSEAILSALLQVCSSSVPLEAAVRAAALRVVQALLSADHKRAASHFLKGEGLSAMVAVLSETDIPLQCKCLAAAVLRDFLVPQQHTSTAGTVVPMGSKGKLPVENAGDSTKHQASQLQPDSPANVASLDAALDEAMARIEQALHAGVLPPLLNLCKAPEGASPAAQSASQGDGTSDFFIPIRPKSAAKKAGSGVKGPEGAEAAQINACSCLKMMSLHDDCKQGIVDSGGIPILLPLLASKVDHVRWSARQVLLNAAMLPDLAERLEREGAPVYIHGMNLVRLRRSQPGRQGSAAATKLLAQLTSQLTVPLMHPAVEAA